MKNGKGQWKVNTKISKILSAKNRKGMGVKIKFQLIIDLEWFVSNVVGGIITTTCIPGSIITTTDIPV